MPVASTMTDPVYTPVTPPGDDDVGPSRVKSSSEGSRTPTGHGRRRRPKAVGYATPTFHLNIGRVEVPRSLPQTRSIATQTDESACSDEAIESKKWYNRTFCFGKTWVMPVLRAITQVLAFLIGRVGFGVRLN